MCSHIVYFVCFRRHSSLDTGREVLILMDYIPGMPVESALDHLTDIWGEKEGRRKMKDAAGDLLAILGKFGAVAPSSHNL